MKKKRSLQVLALLIMLIGFILLLVSFYFAGILHNPDFFVIYILAMCCLSGGAVLLTVLKH